MIVRCVRCGWGMGRMKSAKHTDDLVVVMLLKYSH